MFSRKSVKGSGENPEYLDNVKNATALFKLETKNLFT